MADPDQLARRAARSAATIPGLRRAVERVGAHTVADKLDRVATGGDVMAVTLPPLRHDVRAHRLKMHRSGGHDQVAMAFAEGGWFGFERPLPSLFRLAVADGGGGDVYDVGANTGFYSLLAARSHRRSRIFAFEPLPAVVARLQANLALNGQAGRVVVVERAVGGRDGEAELYVPEPSGETIETSASLNADFKERHAEVLSVEVTTLDRFWTEQGSGAVSVVKVDVEGFEHAVLAGAQGLLEGARPLVFFEVLPGSDTEALEGLRCKVDYLDARLGTREVVVGEAITFDPEGWNHALVPAERTHDLVALATRAGLAHAWA